jgi:RNA polymerase-interacting CarD/CdnL/TRCF family regulator
MKPEQALAMLMNAAQQSKLSYQDHVVIQQSGALLAKELGLADDVVAEGTETEDDGEVQ